MKVLRVIGWIVLVVIILAAVVPFLIPVAPLEGTRPAVELADADSRFIEVNGLDVHYKEAGEGETTYILLHGFGASIFSWREVMQPLAQSGRVIAYDRPAFGLTERPAAGTWTGASPYSAAAQVDLLFGLMDRLGVEKAVLVGNSAGGAVATLAALQQPQRVTALVLVDAAVYSGSPIPNWVRPVLTLPQFTRLGPLFVRGIQTSGEEFLTSAWHDPARVTPAVREGYRKPLQVDGWDAALWQFSIAQGGTNLPDRLSELKVPVLVVSGDDDKIIPLADSRRLAKEIPGAQFVVFRACGHVPQEECPQAFMDAVSDFMQTIQ